MGNSIVKFSSNNGKKVATNDAVEGYCLGLNKGFLVSRNAYRKRHTARRGGERVNLIAKTIKSVAGFAPYEKRAIEMYKVGNTKLDKRANRFLKKRLGSIKRSKKKTEELVAI